MWELHKKMENPGPLVVEKSRDMGMSWATLCFGFWQWMFQPDIKILLVSKDEDAVWKLGDDDALFSKLDRLYKSLPIWMQPDRDFKKLHLQNLETGSTFTGDAATSNAGVGGRYTWIMLDEFALFGERNRGADYEVWSRTSYCSDIRVVISTPRGLNTRHGQLCHDPHIDKLVYHWTRHPKYSQGLYYDGEPIPQHRFFVNGKGHPRSPWYDAKCDEVASMFRINTELNIVHQRAESLVFEPQSEIANYITTHCIDPVLLGRIDRLNQDLKQPLFSPASGGKLELWFPLSGDGKPVRSKYIIGCDVSNGSAAATGRSNSVASVWNAYTREKVAQYCNANITPDEFADISMTLGWWFKDYHESPAHIIWESNGPGQNFSIRLIRENYPNYWIDTKVDAFGKMNAKQPGWYTSNKSKTTLLINYRDHLLRRSVINRSRLAVMETMEFIYAPNGVPTHSDALRSNENSGEVNELHGDRVIADALAVFAIDHFDLSNHIPAEDPKSHEPTPRTDNTLEWRLKQLLQESRQDSHRRAW